MLGFLLAIITGCAPKHVPPEPIVEPAVQHPQPSFAPQSVMDSRDYKGFLTENKNILEASQDSNQRAAALLNIGFVYVYPQSPFYSPTKGLKYLDILVKSYPESPYAYQAKVWMDLSKRNIALDRKQRRLREEVKSIQEDKNKSSDNAAQGSEDGMQTERQSTEEEVRAKDAMIEELNKQIERYRQIDVEIEERERELLN
jgi:hypothetical protein